MPFRKGTTLLTVCTHEGIVMAADDLMYREQEGKTIPVANGVSKVFVLDNVLIGSAGIILFKPVEYELQDWIADFIQTQRGASDKRPSAIAQAIHAKMRDTFQPVDSLVKDGKWESHGPRERLVSYVVAGYTKNFTKPYIYEVGMEVNADGSGLWYMPPLYRPDDNLWIGEDEFFLRAIDHKEPQWSFVQTTLSEVMANVVEALPSLPEGLQEAVTSLVSLVKVEAQFNPDKVGRGVNVALIDRVSRQIRLATF